MDYASRLEGTRTQETNGLEIAKAYGCGNSGEGPVGFARVANCLRDRPASTLLGQSYIEPVIDGKILVESTTAAFAAGRFNRVPVMAGFTQDEGTIFVVALSHQVDASNYASRLDLGGLSKSVPSRYPLTDYPTPLQALAKAVGDYMFACSALQDMDAISRYVPQSYVYQFADQTPASTDAFAKNYPPSIPGTLESLAAHGTDITYWLGLLQPRDAAPARANLSRAMMSYLGNFALHGNPDVVGASRWLPFERANRRVNILGYPITLAADVFASHQCAFWYSASTVEGVWSKSRSHDTPSAGQPPPPRLARMSAQIPSATEAISSLKMRVGKARYATKLSTPCVVARPKLRYEVASASIKFLQIVRH